MAGPSAEHHPDPAGLVAWCERMARELPDARDYIRRTAKMIESRFPASGPRVLPELRRIYKSLPAK